MTLFCESFVTYFLYFKQLNIGLQGVLEEPSGRSSRPRTVYCKRILDVYFDTTSNFLQYVVDRANFVKVVGNCIKICTPA